MFDDDEEPRAIDVVILDYPIRYEDDHNPGDSEYIVCPECLFPQRLTDQFYLDEILDTGYGIVECPACEAKLRYYVNVSISIRTEKRVDRKPSSDIISFKPS